MIAAILFVASGVALALAIFIDDADWAAWVGVISGIIMIACLFFGMYEEEQKPKEIRTEQPPQIDTIIEIRNSIPDTTYVYIFYKDDDASDH